MKCSQLLILKRLTKLEFILDATRYNSVELIKYMKEVVETNFSIGQVVKHKFLDFRGVIFDVDPEFNNTEEWYQSIPSQIRPSKDQPFYHVFAENDDVFYTAYVSQQNLLIDESNEPFAHPDVTANFGPFNGKVYEVLQGARN